MASPNQGYAGTQMAAKAEREPTINDRMNRLAEQFQGHCDRVEAVLSRINGTPRAESAGQAVAQISPTLALITTVEHLEGAQVRLRDLTINLERIA